MPRYPEARVFYRAADERMADARFIQYDGGRTTAGVYLAGYAVECMLKALILSRVARADDRAAMLAEFRGRRGHDFGWLRRVYREGGGSPPPRDVQAALAVVEPWDTDLRYDPRRIGEKEADQFLVAAGRILIWADGRL